MKATADERAKLIEKISATENGGWTLSRDLFGDTGAEIHDFEMHNYVYFLDHVQSLKDLIEGLCQLSPLADDALHIAKRMNNSDFKTILAHERVGKYRIPRIYLPLILPKWFMRALPIAEELKVPLGAVMIRMIGFEENSS